MPDIRGGVFLVTGGTGFLGEHIIQQLTAKGAKEIRVLARNAPGAPHSTTPSLGDVVKYIGGTILDEKSCINASNGVDGIFHVAGQVLHSRHHAELTRQLFATNVEGTLNVIRGAAAAGVKRIVYASTSGTVGCSETADHVATDSSPYSQVAQRWPYYESKIRAEKRALALAERLGVEFVAMRPSMILGPGDTRFRSTHLICSFLRRSIPVTPNGGASIVDVRDTATAFCSAMEIGTPHSTYLLGGTNCTLYEFFDELEAVTGIRKPLLQVPNIVTITGSRVLTSVFTAVGQWKPGFDPVRAEMSSYYWNIDSTRAREELNFNPRPLRETLEDTVEWIRANGPRLGAKL